MASDQYIGCTISLEVGGGLGYYQGQVIAVRPERQTITLCKVLHNGKPIQTPEVTISGPDILSLTVLKTKNENENLAHKDIKPKDKVAQNEFTKKLVILADSGTSGTNNTNDSEESEVSKALVIKRKARTPVGETLATGSVNQREKSSGGKNQTSALLYQSLSTYNEPPPPRSGPPFESNYYRGPNDTRTPNRRQGWKNARDKYTFGGPIDEDILNTEFDFETNLALFDKQAVFDELRSLRPDVVSQADKRVERNYRCDQNVLSSKPCQERQIIVPAAEAGEFIYATDNGLLVPSVTCDLKQNLLSTANQHGLTKSRQLEMIGRGATEIILSVIGGSHRLDPGNSHQSPVVVIFSGAHMQGASGANCARQLESQGVQTILVTPSIGASIPPSILLSHELQLYNMTNGRSTTEINTLPSTVDLIVDARFDLNGNLGVSAQLWTASSSRWASSSRAPIISIDPPPDVIVEHSSPIPRIKLSSALPLSYLPDKGKVYLLNLNVPLQIFSELGIKYTSPFGAKMVIPLHPCE